MALQIAPLIVPERRILVYLYLFVTGIILLHSLPALWHHGDQLVLLLSGGAFMILAAIFLALYARHHAALNGAVRLLIAFILGVVVAAVQFTRHDTPQIGRGITGQIEGSLVKIDGRADARSRLWLRLDTTAEIVSDGHLPAGGIVRVTTDEWQDQQRLGSKLAMRVRLYPPPTRVLAGVADYGRQARAQGVLASGYVISGLRPVADGGDRSGLDNFYLSLARYRAHFASYLVGLMNAPAGAIAAALLVGERRYINDELYKQFRDSGLAHLLAISGLHMGLICFGTMALIRFVGALFPAMSSRFPLHKYAAITAAIIGACYVLMSGAPISAVRAFAMTLLVVLAILRDRMALTLRNVCLAAFVILAVNTMALFSAGFQLSFAATAILVIWYEARARRGASQFHWSLRYPVALITMSLLAAMATAPFAAQHFGVVTPWGVIANIIGIPLTGFWIMPMGMLFSVSAIFGIDWIVAPILAGGINILVFIAGIIAEYPFAGWPVAPPGYTALAVMVSGIILTQLFIKPIASIGWVVGIVGALLWTVRPVPDGALFAVGRTPRLVLAGPGVVATPYDNLSDFLA